MRSIPYLPASVLGLLLLLPLLVGCPKTGTSTASAEAEPEPAPRSRFSGATKTFVNSLTAQPIVVWTVEDSGASVVYDSLSLVEAGTFEAKASVRFPGDPDRFDCTESGSWALDGDKAESATVGQITFELKSTDCPGRTVPTTWRAEATVDGSDINLEHR